MDFTNNNISTEELPAIENVIFHPLEKEYLKVIRISFFIGGLIVIAIGATLFYFIKKMQVPVIIYSSVAVFIILSIAGWISDSISFKYGGYALRDKDILSRKGWFVQKVRVVPLKRIQHVSLQSGPIERKFGLASVSIYTAGSNEADFTIRGITQQTAQQIKEWISIQLNGKTD